METVVVSPRYEVVIPRSMAEKLGIEPGQELQVIEHERRIELIPLRKPGELRGFLRGMNADFEREPDRV
jgi:AbrB family looped-hinge helix DNA binding protein